MVAPNVTISTGTHPILPELRVKTYQYNLPVTIKDGVWIGAGAIILPGVTIGENSVIGAGSVVTKDIPPNVVAVGCPCRGAAGNQRLRQSVLPQGHEHRLVGYKGVKPIFSGIRSRFFRARSPQDGERAEGYQPSAFLVGFIGLSLQNNPQHLFRIFVSTFDNTVSVFFVEGCPLFE